MLFWKKLKILEKFANFLFTNQAQRGIIATVVKATANIECSEERKDGRKDIHS